MSEINSTKSVKTSWLLNITVILVAVIIFASLFFNFVLPSITKYKQIISPNIIIPKDFGSGIIYLSNPDKKKNDIEQIGMALAKFKKEHPNSEITAITPIIFPDHDQYFRLDGYLINTEEKN